ncbi:hypothetical protein [Clavibacter michiganensis]|nr:hypothetical protein [Clavibacter michiganensis]
MIDTDRLLAHLRMKAEHTNPIIHAIYTCLADRITRGDFEPESKDQT